MQQYFGFTLSWWTSCARLTTWSCGLFGMTMWVPRRIRLPDAVTVSSSFTLSMRRKLFDVNTRSFDCVVPVSFLDSLCYGLQGCVTLRGCLDVLCLQGFRSWSSSKVADILLCHFLLSARLVCMLSWIPWQAICGIDFSYTIFHCDLVWLRSQRPSLTILAGVWTLGCCRWTLGVCGLCKLWRASLKRTGANVHKPKLPRGLPALYGCTFAPLLLGSDLRKWPRDVHRFSGPLAREWLLSRLGLHQLISLYPSLGGSKRWRARWRVPLLAGWLRGRALLPNTTIALC